MNTISSQLECISDLCKHCDLYIHIKKQHNTGSSERITVCCSCLAFPSYLPQMSLLEFQWNMRFSWNPHLINIPLEYMTVSRTLCF